MGVGAYVVYGGMAGAIVVGSLVSLSLRPGIRGWRNLSLLATYVLGIVSPLVVAWYAAIAIWIGIGLLAGLAFALYEVWDGRDASPEERVGFDVSHVLYGPIAWPLMTMELFENLFAPATDDASSTDRDELPEASPPKD